MCQTAPIKAFHAVPAVAAQPCTLHVPNQFFPFVFGVFLLFQVCMFTSNMTKASDDELGVCTVSQKLQTAVKTLFITVFSPFYLMF